MPLQAQAGHATKSQFYAIITPSGKPVDPPKGRCWTVTEPVFKELVKEGRTYWGPRRLPCEKRRRPDPFGRILSFKAPFLKGALP